MRVSGWLAKKRFATAVAHATTARNGVKKPRQSENEIIAMRKTTAQQTAGEKKLRRCMTFKTNIAAVAILKSRSPKPGPPCGNME